MTQSISPQEASKFLAKGDAILIDVREKEEFQGEHIAYANSLPLSDLENLFPQLNIPEDRKIIIHCFKGTRGEQACLYIKACGSCGNEIFNLDGGITAWKDAGLPIVGKSRGISIFRQVQIIVGSFIVLLVVVGFMGVSLAFLLAGLLGAALLFAGLTGWCGLAIILKKMPWNK